MDQTDADNVAVGRRQMMELRECLVARCSIVVVDVENTLVQRDIVDVDNVVRVVLDNRTVCCPDGTDVGRRVVACGGVVMVVVVVVLDDNKWVISFLHSAAVVDAEVDAEVDVASTEIVSFLEISGLAVDDSIERYVVIVLEDVDKGLFRHNAVGAIANGYILLL